LRKLVVTFVCENRHNVESVTVELKDRGELTDNEIWALQTKGCRCKKCGSNIFNYHTRYKD